MKLALLLPGYLDSPDYLHLKTFEKRLLELGYTVERLDACHLWETGDVTNYTITNYLKHITETVASYQDQQHEEIVLIGHSMGGFMAIIAGNRIDAVTKIISLCPPPDRYGHEKQWDANGIRHSERDLPNDSTLFRTFDIPFAYVEDGYQYSAKEEVKNIHKPLMIFIALDDVVVPPARTEQIVANANQPYVVRQPNMGHDFRRSQEQCDLVMKEIEKFLFPAEHLIDKLAYIYLKDRHILMTLSKGKDTYYIPGGKREGSETDHEALIREVKEELTVDLLPSTIKHYGTFEAQAHGKPPGTVVRMTCYHAEFQGELQPSSEIQDIAYYTYAQRNSVGPVDQLIFDDLKAKNLID